MKGYLLLMRSDAVENSRYNHDLGIALEIGISQEKAKERSEEKRQIFWQTSLRKILPLLEIPSDLCSVLSPALTKSEERERERCGRNRVLEMGR